jgi:hypothetical protein
VPYIIPVFEYKDNKNKNEWKQQRYSKRSFTSSRRRHRRPNQKRLKSQLVQKNHIVTILQFGKYQGTCGKWQ